MAAPHIITVVVLCIFTAAQTGATSVSHGRHQLLYYKHGHHGREYEHSAYNSRSRRSADYCNAYFKCYFSFMDNYGATYNSMCLARKKLNNCKNVVINSHPAVLKECRKGPGSSLESISDYWCNKTNGFYLFRDYNKCPFINSVIPLYKDFSPELNIQYNRAVLAEDILTQASTAGKTLWKHLHKYSYPDHPVYKALSSIVCAMSRLWVHYDQIINKYCGGYVSNTAWLFYTRIRIPQTNHVLGLVNWNQSRCTTHKDPLEQVMQITQLQDYIKGQIQPNLGCQ